MSGDCSGAIAHRKLVPDEGIEPPTFGLQNRCSTAELIRRCAKFGRRGLGLPCPGAQEPRRNRLPPLRYPAKLQRIQPQKTPRRPQSAHFAPKRRPVPNVDYPVSELATDRPNKARETSMQTLTAMTLGALAIGAAA